jgi:uncharacterized protein YqjF (DUF2071 family)
MSDSLTPADLLRQSQHRPWPLPRQPWILYQEWRDLLFAHWSLDPALLAPLIPPGLELERYEGRAWLGIVPFRMSHVRPRGLPALPWLSYFGELNVRTYVRATQGEARPGVFFFSLDAANPVAVRLARRFYHLPYFDATIGCQRQPDGRIRYNSRRRVTPPAFPGEWIGSYGPSGVPYHAPGGTLEHWLVERYCLYSVDPAGRVHRGEIHHLPWPLQAAKAQVSVNRLFAPTVHGMGQGMGQGIGQALNRPPELLHFVDRLQVLTWGIAPVDGA